MWIPSKEKLRKIRLQSQGEDVETPWAEDLGPVAGGPGSRRVRLGNVPFLHAKPTYGDVVVVHPDAHDGMLTWDSNDVPFEELGMRIEEDSGRWAMILDYELTADAKDATTAFQALDLAGERADIAVEGCYEPRDGRSGRAYLAVPLTMTVAAVLARFEQERLPLSLTLVHPVDHEPGERSYDRSNQDAAP